MPTAESPGSPEALFWVFIPGLILLSILYCANPERRLMPVFLACLVYVYHSMYTVSYLRRSKHSACGLRGQHLYA